VLMIFVPITLRVMNLLTRGIPQPVASAIPLACDAILCQRHAPPPVLFPHAEREDYDRVRPATLTLPPGLTKTKYTLRPSVTSFRTNNSQDFCEPLHADKCSLSWLQKAI
jgi:hypothetical protein